MLWGRVSLWDGWSLALPSPCRVVRNGDGSWSAFDASRVVDVTILTVGSTTDGSHLSAETMLDAPPAARVEDAGGCLSYGETVPSESELGVVFLNVQAAATMTACYLSVGYRDPEDAAWAAEVWRSLAHDS